MFLADEGPSGSERSLLPSESADLMGFAGPFAQREATLDIVVETHKQEALYRGTGRKPLTTYCEA